MRVIGLLEIKFEWLAKATKRETFNC